MQILHPFLGSIENYQAQLSDPDRHRPRSCPQCQAQHPLTAHGFYTRTLIDQAFDGLIRVRRYLCRSCQRTVSLLPEFALPYLRSSIAVIALFLVARLLHHQTLQAAMERTELTSMFYQRGQFWMRRFQQHAASLCAALAALTTPVPATDFVQRGLLMLEATGWIPAHRFLFAELRYHLLGWPRGLAPDGRRATLSASVAPG
jgi:transposase-like protein